ncbi:MAG TPA: Uma2 family endonuclease [Acidobacteriaceae bacterium]|nr:Uma2 family endonuclease [Acidobacteriaceae bacterium]
MSAVPQPQRISVEEYLTTAYRPDCDYVDGEVLERNLGTFDHALLQGLLVRLLLNNAQAWQCVALPEQRVRIGGGRYRVPDICVIKKSAPREQVITQAPMLCIEILSPEDRWSRVRERVEDYFVLGTENVWMIDPELRKGYVCSRRGYQEPEDGVLQISGTPIRVVLSELFAELDRA